MRARMLLGKCFCVNFRLFVQVIHIECFCHFIRCFYRRYRHFNENRWKNIGRSFSRNSLSSVHWLRYLFKLLALLNENTYTKVYVRLSNRMGKYQFDEQLRNLWVQWAVKVCAFPLLIAQARTEQKEEWVSIHISWMSLLLSVIQHSWWIVDIYYSLSHSLSLCL